MDPVTLVVTALVAGASAGTAAVATEAIKDAYQGLRALVIGLLSRRGSLDERDCSEIVDGAAVHEMRRNTLVEELTRAEVDEPTQQAAQELLELIEKARKAKFVIQAPDARGLMIGDSNTQHNSFN